MSAEAWPGEVSTPVPALPQSWLYKVTWTWNTSQNGKRASDLICWSATVKSDRGARTSVKWKNTPGEIVEMMLFDVAQWMSPCRMGEAVPSMNCEHVVLVCAIIAVHSRHLKRPAPLAMQPFASVIVTVYSPVSATVMDCVMAPLLQ